MHSYKKKDIFYVSRLISSPKLILGLFVKLTCVIGMLVQTSILLEQYMSGRTIVNIMFKGLSRERLPSFTICYPCYMSLERAAQFTEENQKVFNEYKSIIDSNSLNDSKYNIFTNKKLYNFYHGAYETFGQKRPDSMPIIDLFEKLSVPYNWSDSTGQQHSAVYINAHGIYEYPNGSIVYTEVKDMDPIETFAAEYAALCIRKCYTFFSALNKKWRDFELEVDYTTIKVIHNNYWFSPSIYDMYSNGIFLSMHSPNTLPNIMNGENFFLLDTQAQYLLTYSRITTELMDSKYDTNCREYDLDDNTTHVNMKTDCFSLCILEAMKKECRIDCVFQTDALLRKQLFIGKPFIKYCDDENKSAKDCLAREVLLYKSRCNKKCQSACVFNYFDWDLIKERSLNVSKWDKQNYINVKHNRLPDQIVKHFPETTFISFVSSFGGLLGMWLGMSFLASFDAFYILMQKRILSNKLLFKRPSLSKKFNENQHFGARRKSRGDFDSYMLV